MISTNTSSSPQTIRPDAAAVTTKQTANWAGAVKNTAGIRAIESYIKVPNYTTGTAGDRASGWVGLGGSGEAGGTLVQAGVETRQTTTTATFTDAGKATERLWWEIVPGYTEQIIGNQLGTAPGDIVDTLVSWASGKASFSFYNTRTKVAVDIVEASPKPGPSAEAIGERQTAPVSPPALYPLVNFQLYDFQHTTLFADGETRGTDMLDTNPIAYDCVSNGFTYMKTTLVLNDSNQRRLWVNWKHR